jgi:hypothetical protein
MDSTCKGRFYSSLVVISWSGRRACPRSTAQSLTKRIGSNPVPKRLDAINGDDRNVMLITSQKLGITFNVDLLERIFIATVCGLHRLLSVIAKMTTRARVQDYLTFLEGDWRMAHKTVGIVLQMQWSTRSCRIAFLVSLAPSL